MDGQCEKGNSDKKHKVSVGRSLTMRFSNFRSRGKAVDKCGRLTGNVMEVGRPLTTSLSMGAMDKAIQQREIGTDRGVPRLCQACSSKAWSQEVCGHEERKKCNKSCQETFCKCMRCYRKAKGRSFDGTSSYSPDSDKLPVLSDSFVGNGGGRHTGLMSVSVSGSCVSGRPAPAVPPPYLPVYVHNKDRAVGPLNKSWDRIYASRQEWLTMAKSHRSSLKEKLQEELLSCKICLESYQRPKALPCLHTFCEHCLQDYVRRNTGHKPGYFACPMCRKEICIPDGGIEEFQDNFILRSLSDTLDEEGLGDNWPDSYETHIFPPRHLAPPTPLEQTLRQHEWYFGKVSRNASEEWLLTTGYPNGSFLIRQGEASPDTLTLSVRDCDELRGYVVKHYKIHTRRYNGLSEVFFIAPKRSFQSVEELVDHYKVSADGLCCKLTQVCGKPRSLSWAQERGKDDEYTIPRESIQTTKRLGSGQFADVYLGNWNHRNVAVKVQRPDTVKMAAFLDEAQILKTLDHPNILKLLAVCSAKEPVYLVIEYMVNGRLSLYLREGQGSELKLSQLVWICAQVADALAYMEKEKFIHRNIGARNILVGEKNKVKVAGFGMTKCADDPDFNFRRGLKMAIKWMAPEVLLYNKYSTKADVWSFGVLMMEVMTHGKEPYEGMGSKEAFENVQQGYRMPCPDMCPSEIYDVILSCWSNNPPSRPSFDFLNTFLHDRQAPT